MMNNNNKNSKPYESEMTYSQANALNKYYGKEGPAFMASIGTEENPEFLYPEELQASTIKAFNSYDEERNFKVDQYLKELSRRKAENPLADILAGTLFGVAGGGILNGISQGLNGINIGKTIAKPTWNATKHVVKSALNPMNAYTGVGQAAGVTADAYFAYDGLKNVSRIVDKWRRGEFNHQDIPEFVLNVSSTVPLINYGTNVYRNATNAFDNIKRINQAKKISTSDYDDFVRTKAMSNDYVNASDNVTNAGQVRIPSSNTPIISDFWKYREAKGTPHGDPITIAELNDFVNLYGWDGGKLILTKKNINLKTNWKNFKNDLLTSNTYHHALTPDKLLQELPLMSKVEIPVFENMDIIKDYFKDIALPKLLRNAKKDGFNLTPEEIKYISDMYSDPLNGVNMHIGYTEPGYGGFARGGNFIRFSNRHYTSRADIPDATIVHELHHSLRSRLRDYLLSRGYNISDDIPDVLQSGDPIRNRLMKGEYFPSELETMEPLAMLSKYVDDKSPISEIGAVVAGDASWNKYMNLRKTLERKPTLEELTGKVNFMDDTKLVLNSQKLPYGTQIGSRLSHDLQDAYKQEVFRYNELPFYKKWFTKAPEDLYYKKMSDVIKKAMNTIAGGSAVTVGGGMLTDQTD